MTTYEDEFVYKAWVQDDTEKFFKRFDAFATQYRANANKAFEASTGGAQRSEAALAALIGAVSSLTGKLIDMGLAAVKSLGDFAKQSVELAARVETLGINVYRIGERMGYSQERTDEVVNSLKDLGITTQGAYNSLLLLSRANVDWSEATTLARVAQDAAVIAGINSSEAFERLARGIQKMEPELLDELGITLRRTDAYTRYAQTLNKNVKELTDVEQKQAILNEIYRQSGVVAGAYEASMETAGKQAASLARHVEELQLAIGNAFLPVYQARVEFMTNALKMMREFVEDNKEELQQMGQIAGTSLQRAAKIVLSLMQVTIKAAEAFKRWNEHIKHSQTLLASLDKNVGSGIQSLSKLANTAGKALAIVAGAVAAAMSVYAQVQGSLTEMMAAWNETLAGRMSIEELAQTSAEVFDNLKPGNLVQGAKNEFNQTFKDIADSLGLLDENAGNVEQSMDDMGDSMEDVDDSASEMELSVQDLTDDLDENTEAADKAAEATRNLEQAQKALDSIRKQHARSEEDRLIQERRKAIEEAIQLSKQRLEIERRYQDSVDAIHENARKQAEKNELQLGKDIAKAAKDHADERVAIEEEHLRTLEEIRRNFIADATELARSRDGEALAKLIRTNKRELAEEEIARQENLDKADKAYEDEVATLEARMQEQQEVIEESLAEQLAAAEEQRQKDYQNLERSLDEQRQMKALHDRWDAEDRQRALRRQLEDWREQYLELEGVTAQALDRMLGGWGAYMTGVTGIVQSGMNNVSSLLNGSSGGSSSGGGSGYTPPSIVQYLGNNPPVALNQNATTQPQATQQMYGMHSTSHTTSYNVDRRERALSVSGNIDPYIQQAIRGMLDEDIGGSSEGLFS